MLRPISHPCALHGGGLGKGRRFAEPLGRRAATAAPTLPRKREREQGFRRPQRQPETPAAVGCVALPRTQLAEIPKRVGRAFMPDKPTPINLKNVGHKCPTYKLKIRRVCSFATHADTEHPNRSDSQNRKPRAWQSDTPYQAAQPAFQTASKAA